MVVAEPSGQLQTHIDKPASHLDSQLAWPGMRDHLRLRPLSGKSQKSWAPDLVLPLLSTWLQTMAAGGNDQALGPM